MKIIEAKEEHLHQVAEMLNMYRVFYEQDSDLDAATIFVRDRLCNKESIIFLALDDNDKPIGFTQVYPSFCSVDLCKIYILYDLYVIESVRKKGIGQKLIAHVNKRAMEEDVKRIDLLTGCTNHAGQNLYRKLNFKESNQEFLSMSLEVM